MNRAELKSIYCGGISALDLRYAGRGGRLGIITGAAAYSLSEALVVWCRSGDLLIDGLLLARKFSEFFLSVVRRDVELCHRCGKLLGRGSQSSNFLIFGALFGPSLLEPQCRIKRAEEYH